jgi:hypothetical protein
MHKRARRDAERDRRERPLGNPLVAGSSLARPTDEYHVPGSASKVLLHQWPSRRICQRLDASGVVSTAPPGNGVEPQWNATIRTPRGVGRLFDSLKLWA